MGHRLERVSELIRAEVSDLLLRGIRDPRVTGLCTVTSVELTRDLKQARVYVSVLGAMEEQVQALRGLQSARPFVRREVARRLRLRFSPAIDFFLDHSIERGSRVLALMKELGLEEAPAEKPDASKEEEPPRDPGGGT
jgi:ribosome-binding factor A